MQNYPKHGGSHTVTHSHKMVNPPGGPISREMPTPAPWSTLSHYFCRPQTSFFQQGNIHHFRDLTYIQYYCLFRLQRFNPNHVLLPNHFTEEPNDNRMAPMQVILQNDTRKHLAHIHDVPPSRGELFYLRALLQHRPAMSFEDPRTVNGVVLDSYLETTTALGLFANEKESEYALLEGVQALKTPCQLRLLFAHLLVNDCIPTPLLLWQKFTEHLAYTTPFAIKM